MVALFGLDIEGIVASAIADAGGLQAGVLEHGATSHTFQGFVSVQEVRVQETLIVEARPVLTIVGGTLEPPVAPAVNDLATVGSITYELTRLVARDPAAAVYEFEVR